MSSSDQNFGRLRTILWPIHRHELKKLIPMLGIFFFISLNYNILRNLKDAIVITAKGSGAEVIPFIKVWVMLPGALVMTAVFAWLSRRLSRENVFYAVLGLFLGYYAIFTFVLFPARDVLHPHALADSLQGVLPTGAKGFISMFRYWTFSSFYAMSELWGNIVLFLCFWGFANEVTKVDEAKRFYGLFGIGANLAGIVAGQTSYYISQMPYTTALPFGSTDWEQSLILLTSIVLVSGVACMVLYKWMNASLLNDPRFYCQDTVKKRKKAQESLSLRESFAYLARSPYLMGIAALVLCYNLSINLVEVIWKDQVRAQYSDPSHFNAYMNQVTTWIGIVSTFAALLISGNAIRKRGWTFTALLTPVVMLVTSIGFFSFMFFQGMLGPVAMGMLNMTPLAIIVFFGSTQNVLCRGAKYTVFDATKELAFVPLSDECKIKGKTAIDGVGTRLGKSGGSVIHQALLIVCSSLAVSAPYVAAILFVTILIWMTAIVRLGKQFNELVAEHEKAEARERTSDAENEGSAVVVEQPKAGSLTQEQVV